MATQTARASAYRSHSSHFALLGDNAEKFVALTLAAIPTLGGTRRGLLVPGMRISEVLSLVLLGFLIWRLHTSFKFGGALFWALFGYAGVTAAIVAYHWFNSTDLGSHHFLAYGLGPTTLLVSYVAAYAGGAASPGLLLKTCRYLILMATAMGVLGILQTIDALGARELAAAVTGNMQVLDVPDWKVPRSTGIFHSWHAYSSYMAVMLVLGAALVAHGLPTFRTVLRHQLCIFVIAVGLASALTFGTLLLGVIGLAYFLIRKGRVVQAMVGCIAAYFVFRSTPLSDDFSARLVWQESTRSQYPFLPQTVAFRLELWARDFLPLFESNPIFGYGPIRDSDRVFSSVESMYVLALVVTGAVGFLALLAFLFLALVNVSRYWRDWKGMDARPIGPVSEALGLCLLGLVVLMFIHPYLNDAGSSELVVVLLGICGGNDLLAKACGVSASFQGQGLCR